VDYTISDAIEDDGGPQDLLYSAERDFYYRLPAGYNAAHAREYPLVVFLHGASQTQYLKGFYSIGLGQYDYPDWLYLYQATRSNAFRAARHCFVLVPQQSGVPWDASRVAGDIEEMITSYKIDVTRLYILGWSMGGFGLFDVADACFSTYARTFAAAVPMTGYYTGPVVVSDNMKEHTSIWAWCGDGDTETAIADTLARYEAISDYAIAHDGSETDLGTRSITANDATYIVDELETTWGGMTVARHSLMVGQGHYIQKLVFDDPVMIDWLFAQSLGNHP
jgi:predicted peptidase